jgi:hypothetical protein
LDQRVIDVDPIGQEHIGKDALVLVVAVSPQRHVFPKTKAEAASLALWP